MTSSLKKTILKYIHDNGGAATAYNISKNTNISYATVKKYLKILHREGLLEL